MSKPSQDKKKRRLARQAKKDTLRQYMTTLVQLRAAGYKNVRFKDNKVFDLERLIEGLRHANSPELRDAAFKAAIVGRGYGAGEPDAGVPEELDGVPGIREEAVAQATQGD